MKNNFIKRLVIVIIFLVIGWMMFIILNQGFAVQAEDQDFQTWFWEKRGLDLVIQVVLIFAGALGITAILPMREEEDE
jgi:hypothetical protein